MSVTSHTTNPSSPLPHQQADPPNDSSRYTTDDSNPHQSFLGDLVIDQASEAVRLEIMRFEVEQRGIIAASVGVVAELVVAQREVVQALPAAVGRGAEDLGEQPDAFLLLVSIGGFYQALLFFQNEFVKLAFLSSTFLGLWESRLNSSMAVTHPCVVEFGLQGHKLAFFFVLGAEDLQFFWLERSVTVRGISSLVRVSSPSTGD